MNELMRKHEALSDKNRELSNDELTCSVQFRHAKLPVSTSSEEELGPVTRLVSKAEELELDSIFKRESVDLSTNRSLFECGYNFEEVRDWMSIEQPPKESLKVVLRYMVENHLKTTLQIEINKMYFNCHIIVLQAYSKYFRDLEEIPLVVTLPEEKVSQKSFMLIYKWMISDDPQLELRNIVTVFVAATYLRIEFLLLQCWQKFEDLNCFNEDTACILYVESNRNPALDIVRNLMLTRIQKFLLTFVATREFLNVPLKHLIYLLNSNEICVNTEIEILFIVVRWLGHDWSKRKSNVSSLIGCIRFAAMPLSYLLCVRRLESHKLIKELLQLPAVDAIINESIFKITSNMYEQKMQGYISDLGNVRKNIQQRRWLHDEACPYFHHISCPHTRDINFKQFEAYLTILQQKPRYYWAKMPLLDLNNTKTCDCMQ
ncbi:uncharacterized protein LOC6560415 [Drosophila grimshawi]|uniref:GH21146 n=1 Tax=Drosophila grimshawi TaxID=7222 RepID=B4J6D7_DROGR|nr:uncharacterized protein LOC6560415 [Drosophila grimshawi]EDW00910.1 GH21146 [Drosophila grimshawi]